MEYTTLGNGWVNLSQFFENGSNRPKYIGNVEIDEHISKNDVIQIALWERGDSYSIKISKKDD